MLSRSAWTASTESPVSRDISPGWGVRISSLAGRGSSSPPFMRLAAAFRPSASSTALPEKPVSSFFTSVRVSAARALLWARYPSPGPMRRTVAFCRRMRGMLWGEMPPSAPGSQGQRQHSGRRAATAAITGSTLASVTMPAPVRRAPSTVSAAAPR